MATGEDTNYFEESYYSNDANNDASENTEAPQQEQVQAPPAVDATAKIEELENNYRAVLAQQEQQKQAIGQAYGFNQQPQVDPNVLAAQQMIDERVNSRFGQNYQRELEQKISLGIQGNNTAIEHGFTGYADVNGNQVSAWESACNTYQPMLLQRYQSGDPQTKAQIENIWNLARTPGQQANALKQASTLTNYSPQQIASQANQNVNQTLGHPPGTAQNVRTGTASYSSHAEFLKDYYDGEPTARARAEAELRAGRVPNN